MSWLSERKSRADISTRPVDVTYLAQPGLHRVTTARTVAAVDGRLPGFPDLSLLAFTSSSVSSQLLSPLPYFF